MNLLDVRGGDLAFDTRGVLRTRRGRDKNDG